MDVDTRLVIGGEERIDTYDRNKEQNKILETIFNNIDTYTTTGYIAKYAERNLNSNHYQYYKYY